MKKGLKTAVSVLVIMALMLGQFVIIAPPNGLFAELTAFASEATGDETSPNPTEQAEVSHLDESLISENENEAISQTVTRNGIEITVETANDAATGAPVMGTGYIPDHHVLTATDDPYNPNASLMGIVPSAYSSVDLNRVTVPKDQNPYGTCWAFSTINCLESSTITNEGTSADDIDLSELHLIYFTYNRPTDPLGLTEGDSVGIKKSTILDIGGNYSLAAKALTSGMGPVNDSVMSYDKASASMQFDKSLAFADRQMSVENVLEISAGNSSRIKQLVMEYGSAGMSYYHSESYYNSANCAYYNNSTRGVNHAVSIVGWDDNYSKNNFNTAPASDGAWLIKNSWSEDWGDNGYFWLSYEDKAFSAYDDGTYNTVFVFDATTVVDEDEYIYQYDGGSVSAWTTIPSSNVKIAGVYTAQRNETIDAASVVIYSDNVEYTLQVYKNPTSTENPISGEPLLEEPVSGYFADAGYHTVDIPSAPEVEEGDVFTVVFSFYASAGNFKFPIDKSYEDTNFSFRTSQDINQTYYYAFNWTDLGRSFETARIKAFTTPVISNDISGVCGDNLTWSIDENGLLTISGTGPMYDWASIDDVPWVDYSAQIKSVVIGDGVTSVGAHAFEYHANITSVSIGKDVETIGTNAFFCCVALEDVTLVSPDSNKLTTIGDYAFFNCKALSEFSLSGNITSIGNYAFGQCLALSKVDCSSYFCNLETIGDHAFDYCGNLTDFAVSYSVESIGKGAFTYCTRLSSFEFGPGLTYIGDEAFYYCPFVSVRLPYGLTEINPDVFHYSSLESIDLPNTVKVIRDSAFHGSDSITEVVIPKSVTNIEARAFNICNGITDVYFTGTEEEWNAIVIDPSGNEDLLDANIHFNFVRTVLSGTHGEDVEWVLYENGLLEFTGTGPMRECDGESTMPEWYHHNDIFYDQPSHMMVRNVVIEDGITTIGAFAFQGCDNLADVDIPASVVTISDYAFSSISGLESIYIGDGVTSIGSYAFGFTDIKEIELNDVLKEIGSSAFYRCDMTSIDLPDSLETIGEYAFSSCSNLTQITIPGKVTDIPAGAFEDCTSLTAITLDSGIKSIGRWAFETTTALTDVYFNGTEEEWNQIAIAENNTYLLQANIHFKYESFTIDKTELVLTVNATGTLSVSPETYADKVEWSSSDERVATVVNGTVTAIGAGTATITAKYGSLSATCTVTVEVGYIDYDITPNINGGASKLYEPWGLRYFAAYNGKDVDKIADRGIAILKDTYYTDGMTAEEFCASENVHIYLESKGELGFEEASTNNPNGRYYATLTEGIFSYDIGAYYYVLPYAVMENGQIEYGTIKSNSMEKILNTNLNLTNISGTEKAICTCILELKKSVAAHYAANGVPGASIDMDVPRGSSQTAANSITSTTQSGITPNIVAGASRLIEPWGLRYFATYTESSSIADRGVVILCEKYYDSSYSTAQDNMRLNANSYVFTESNGTLLYDEGTGRYYATVTEGISSKDVADVYYVVPYVVLNNGSYVYGTVKSNSMIKIMNTNLNAASVPETEKEVSRDIIDLYEAVQAYYAV